MSTYRPILSLFVRIILMMTGYLLFHYYKAVGQQSVYISPGSQVSVFAKDTISIFGDATNAGQFGSSLGSVVNFLGSRWQNMPESSLPGEKGDHSTGGLFRFMGTKTQTLEAGYQLNSNSGPSFPNLSVENIYGVRLADLNDLRVRDTLHFSKGHLYLNGWNTLVEGAVTGYSKNGFVVTGNGIGGGNLYLVSDDPSPVYVFPIGTDDDSYTPLAIQASTAFRSRIAARVFDHVYETVSGGQLLDTGHVKKTWQLTAVQGVPQTTLLLQHPETDEGVRFGALRDSSYISLYRLANQGWDTDSMAHSVSRPGSLTTSTPVNATYLNDRSFLRGIPLETIDSVSWFSVATNYNSMACPLADFKLWAAQRQNYRWVQLFWRTTKELNVVSYELQRKHDTGTAFKTIETVNSQSIDGFSNHLLYYYYADDNQYDGWTSYRLKMKSAGGCIVYTDVQTVPWGIGVEVWPNPSPGTTHVRITGIKHSIILQVVNTWGQIVRQYNLNYDSIIDLDHLSDAVYFIVVRDPKRNNQKVKTVKLVVQHTR